MRKLHFFLLLGICWAGILSAQKDSLNISYDTDALEVKTISDSDLSKFYEDKAFQYEVDETDPTWWDDFKSWLNNLMLRIFENIFGIEEASGILAAFIRLVPYLLLGVLIYILIRFFLNINASALKQASKNKALVSVSEEEHIIKNENIQDLINQALAKKDFRLAVRYSYLQVLKLMSEKEIITWELQKTNDDYLNEIAKTELQNPFTSITRLYNFTWYGDFHITEIEYRKAEKTFLSIEKIISSNG
ncbi:DUF4129 domain-containing protein [Zobellia amurskyensis]|uniref:DUF4129 domain-containing protein n=1 Tax=Zobellia amurskyensis TaxID=248905 RepID=A0A7X2ZV68_9FLAO|nr:DUF4129 domain-containing protein [Zobellia amurskyensis]MUH37015.1 DUF4129 domain-containing protein [Zobellia amurskyensis]